jgi:hypothetical protein
VDLVADVRLRDEAVPLYYPALELLGTIHFIPHYVVLVGGGDGDGDVGSLDPSLLSSVVETHLADIHNEVEMAHAEGEDDPIVFLL